MWGNLAQEQSIVQALLDAAGLPAEVERTADHGEAHWFYLRTPLDPSAFVGLHPAVARAFGGAQMRVRPHPPWLVLEIVRPAPLRRFTLADVWAHVAALSPFTALLGVSEDDAPVHLTLDYPDNASLLVSGGTESGKSNLLRLLVLSAAISTPPRELRMALLHGPRGDALQVVRAFPHVWHVTARPALPMLVKRLRRRSLRGRPPLVLVVLDDVDDVLVRSGARGEDALHWLLSEGASHHVVTIVAARTLAHLPAPLRDLHRLHLAATPAGAHLIEAGTPLPPRVQGAHAMDAIRSIDWRALPPRVQGAHFTLRHASLGTETTVRVPWCGERACAHVVRWYLAHRPVVEPLAEGESPSPTPSDEAEQQTPLADGPDDTIIPELTLDDE